MSTCKVQMFVIPFAFKIINFLIKYVALSIVKKSLKKCLENTSHLLPNERSTAYPFQNVDSHSQYFIILNLLNFLQYPYPHISLSSKSRHVFRLLSSTYY